jgi:hypothetical protein
VRMPFLVGAALSVIAAGLLFVWFPPNKPVATNDTPHAS